jgi:hypothetical protein
MGESNLGKIPDYRLSLKKLSVSLEGFDTIEMNIIEVCISKGTIYLSLDTLS